MALSRKPCAQCKKPVQLTTISHLSGEEGGYRVVLKSLPIMMCADNHKRLINPDFAMQILDVIGRGELSGVYAAYQRGFLRRRTYCARCGFEINKAILTNREFRASMAVESGPTMEITINAPCLRCITCGIDQLPEVNEPTDRIFRALARAFRGEEIHAA